MVENGKRQLLVADAVEARVGSRFEASMVDSVRLAKSLPLRLGQRSSTGLTSGAWASSRSTVSQRC